MKNTTVLIDGFNLYYGLLKGTQWKWLDLVAFSQELLGDDHNILAVRYFTAPIKTHPHDPEAIDRQKTYLHVLSEMGQVRTTLGFYSKRNSKMPAIEAACQSCATADEGLVRVIKLEEKRSDVNLAVAVMLEAAKPEVDGIALVTGDSDQVGAIEAARYVYGKRVLVFNPHPGLSTNLKRAASYYKNIPRDLPAKCQLPDAIPVGTHGNVIRRPAAWK